MKVISQPAVTSLGATAIISISWLAPITSDLHQTVFKLGGSLNVLLVPLFCVIGAIWIFWYLALKLSQRNEQARFCTRVVLTLIVIRETIENVYAFTSPDLSTSVIFPPHWVNVLCKIGFLILVIALVILRRRAPKVLDTAKQFGLTILAFAALSGTFTFARVAVFGWQARHLNAQQPLHSHVDSAKPTGPRIVWVLLDELSYRQVYEHRYPDLQLPAFDQLARESVVFADARPIGIYTINVIPALLNGVPNSATKASATGRSFSSLNSKTGKRDEFEPSQTVFQDAIDDGYSPAVAGWVIPYCRILSAQLDHCASSLGGSWINYLSNQTTIAGNMKAAFVGPVVFRLGNGRMLELWNRWAGPLRLKPVAPPPAVIGHGAQAQVVEGRAVAYEKLRMASLGFLRDPSINFLYIHMNTPHPPGFFNRHTGKFGKDGTYIDNLALCDQFVGEIRSVLEAEGTWNDTTLLIMGDHSWRTFLWAKMQWTAEDAAATDGGAFDDRPGYIVHLAGETTPLRIDTPFEAIRTRALVRAIMLRQIVTPEQLQQWAQRPGE